MERSAGGGWGVGFIFQSVFISVDAGFIIDHIGISIPSRIRGGKKYY